MASSSTTTSDEAGGSAVSSEPKQIAAGQAPWPAQRSARRYLVVGALLTGLAGTVIAAANLLANPFGCFPSFGVAEWERQSRQFGTRTAKAESLVHGDWSCVLIGSSRIESGLDPDSPAWKGQKVYNAGLTTTCMRECRLVVERALQNPSVRRIVLAVDFDLFNELKPCGEDFARSRFNPGCRTPEYVLENLFGVRAFQQSSHILLGLDQPPQRVRANGFRHSEGDLPAAVQLEVIESQLRKFAEWDHLYGDFRYTGLSLAEFRASIELCRDRGCQLTIVIPPVHAAQLELIHQLGLWELYERWEAEAASCVDEVFAGRESPPIWDFAAYDPANTEPLPTSDGRSEAMKWYWETSHFRSELGEVIISQVEGHGANSAPLTGVRVDSKGLQKHFAERSRKRAAFLEADPRISRFISQIRGQSSPPPRERVGRSSDSTRS